MGPLLISLAILATAQEPAALPIDPVWSQSPVWDDGLAEVALYDARRRVYGIERIFETVLITVKEDFDPGLAVKADPPYEGRDLLTVLKLNILSTIGTENYSYNYMTSVFVRRDDPRSLVKLAQSSQEWCGTTFKEAIGREGRTRLEYHSYFDRQADGFHPMPLDTGTLLEEQLLLLARAIRIEPGEEKPARLYKSIVSNSVEPPSSRLVTIRASRREEIDSPAGRFRTLRIDVWLDPGAEKAILSLWIEEAPRRALVKMEAEDGRGLLLREVSRRNYWSR